MKNIHILIYTLFTQITNEELFSNKLVTNFKIAFKNLKFVDGTPLGIKENKL